MNGREFFDILNSAPVFGLLFAITVGIWLLVLKKDLPSKPQSRKR